MVALPEKHNLTEQLPIIFFLYYEEILSEDLLSWVGWPKKVTLTEDVQDAMHYLNCYWHNTSSRLKHLFKVQQLLSPEKVGVPMTDVKEARSSDGNAHIPKEKLHGYKGFLGFGSQNEDFQNIWCRGKWTLLLNAGRLEREKLGHITHDHAPLSGSCVGETTK